MKTIFEKTLNGKNIKIECKEATGSLWLSVDGKRQIQSQELYQMKNDLRNNYGVILTVEDCRGISSSSVIPTTTNLQNLVSEARQSGDINKFQNS